MGALSPLEACEKLAEVLHNKLEELDPSEETARWDEISEHERAIYVKCVKAMLWSGLVESALPLSLRPTTT